MASRNNSFTAVIVGANAAGLSAASKIRRMQPQARVLVFEKSPDVSYAACGIPYWIEGTVPSAEKLVQLTPETIREKRGIELFLTHTVVHLDAARKQATVVNSATGREFSMPFDRALIATGARAILPKWPGSDAKNIFTIRSLDDGKKLQAALTARVQHVAIIGGGYIGLEMAEALRARQRKVTLIEKLPQILPGYETQIAQRATELLKQHGITVYSGVEVTGFEVNKANTATAIRTASLPPRIEADMVLVAVGVRPEVELARQAGIALGTTGAIATNDYLQTNHRTIFAAGDCIEVTHQLSGKKVWLPLGPAANKQGRIAGENMAGAHVRYWGALGTAVFRAFGLEIARAGLSTGEAEQAFGSAVVTHIRAHDIAGYMPGEKAIDVVLIHDKRTKRLLGAQLAGHHCIGKRVDVLAAAMFAKMTVSDLQKLDLSYAPPVAPVWDPLLIAANVAAAK